MMMKTFMMTLLPLMILGATACERLDESRPLGMMTSDSAGVALIDNHVDLGAISRIAVDETLRLGELDGAEETQFHLVRPVALDPEGRIYVPLLGSNEIRTFTSDGEYLRSIGRQGEGPGEFMGLAAVFFLGDTLLAIDANLSRITAFDLTGEVLGVTSAPRVASRPVAVRGWFGGVWMFSFEHPFDWPDHNRFVERRGAVISVRDAATVNEAMRRAEELSVADAPMFELSHGRMYGMTMGQARTGQLPFWEPSQNWTADHRGYVYVTARGEYRIDVLDHEGQLVRRIRRSHEPVPITAELRRRVLDAAMSHYDTTETVTEFGTDPVEPWRFRADLPTPSHLPALGRLISSNAGALLAERPDRVESPAAIPWTALGPQTSYWDYFDPSGRFLGEVAFPAGFTPHALGREFVLGTMRDELGVESVVRFDLVGDRDGTAPSGEA